MGSITPESTTADVNSVDAMLVRAQADSNITSPQSLPSKRINGEMAPA